VTAALGPIITVIALPTLFRGLRITAAVKASHLSFIGTVKATVGAMLRVDDTIASLLVMASQPLLAVLGLFTIATFIQLLAEHYGVPEGAIIRPIAFAFGVICPLVILAVLLLQQALLFVFIA
jgi:hypothetical protein